MSQKENILSNDLSDWMFDLKHHLLSLGYLNADLSTDSPRLQKWLETAFLKDNSALPKNAKPTQYWLQLKPRIREEALLSLYHKICDEIDEKIDFNCLVRFRTHWDYVIQNRK